MVRSAICVALALGAGGHAWADPGAAPACAVTIARAPDAVRVVVERWLAADKLCSGALEVRIVETASGLYLFARDDQGRVRERVVPDADAAGVLIASWATPADRDEPLPRAPVVQRASLQVGPPGVTAQEPAISPLNPWPLASEPAASRPDRWLAVDTLVGFAGNEQLALRVAADVWQRRAWVIGAAGSLHAIQDDTAAGQSAVKAEAYVARTVQVDRWHARVGLGLGWIYRRGEDASAVTTGATGTTPSVLVGAVELGASAGYAFDERWAVELAAYETIRTARGFVRDDDTQGGVPADFVLGIGIERRL